MDVEIDNGALFVTLGNKSPITLPFDEPYYLGIQIETDPEMSPRQPLHAVPHAFRAASVDTTITAVMISDASIAHSKLAGICNEGEMLITIGNSWVCVPGTCASGDAIDCLDYELYDKGIGVCQARTRECLPDSSGFGACSGTEVLKLLEVCDGEDNDCDGETDENCLDVGPWVAPYDLSVAPPHDTTRLPSGCWECHSTVRPKGFGMTIVEDVNQLCLSCHQLESRFAAWDSSRQAVPGISGTSHRWDAEAVNPGAAASLPTNPELASMIHGGKLSCSTCHDPHQAENFGGTTTSTVPVKVTDGGGTGSLTVEPVASNATAKHYTLKIVATTPQTTFQISNDSRTSWFGWNGSSWEGGYPAGRPVGSSVGLNDGTNVSVTFSGAFAVGDAFQFSILHPMLRSDLTDSALCYDCHSAWAQSSAEMTSGGDGVQVFSHPVGTTVVHAGTILDANGGTQGVDGDSNASNDLLLGTTNQVHCLTCHSVHGCDSNSLTEDQ